MFHAVVTWSLLALALLQPACEGSSLGAVVHVVPLDSSQGQTVRAHFTVLAPLVKDPLPTQTSDQTYSCPDLPGPASCLSGEDCMNHTASVPIAADTAARTHPGWCVRQWQKTVPSHYTATIALGYHGSSVKFYLSFKATPTIRPNNGGLNQPPYVGLPPPLRARKDCPHHYHLSVKDLDGDTVRCRFAGPVECPDCTLHTFIELDQEHCMVTFTGHGPVGQYFMVVMVEDHYPAPKKYILMSNQALSSVPVHLSLTVEQWTPQTPCSAEPLASSQTPRENALLDVLQYEQIDVTVSFISQLESVSEIAVVGPPALFRSHLSTAASHGNMNLASMKLSWVRGPNSLAPLLPICYSANTNSLQSDTRCLWLYQRQNKGLPAGSVLKCEATVMSLVLSVSSLNNIQLSELQLNSATCPVTYNSTHLTALISLTGCGTKTVHSGNELVYTNTLRSVRPYTTVSRLPSLVLPLACRIPGVVARGPHFHVPWPSAEEVFGGNVSDPHYYSLDFSLVEPNSTKRFRSHLLAQAGGRAQRDVSMSLSSSLGGSGSWLDAVNRGSSSRAGAMGSKLQYLYLSVTSRCTVPRAELLVEKCMEAETEDMADPHPLMENGCSTNGSALQVMPTDRNSKVYRMDLSAMTSKGNSMYMECIVYLCIATMPGQSCPVPQCNSTGRRAQRAVENSYEGSRITVRSGAVSLVVTPAPAVAVAPAAATTATASATTTTAAATTTTAAAGGATTAADATAASNTEPGATEAVDLAATVAQTTPSHAPRVSSSITVGVLLTAVCVFLN